MQYRYLRNRVVGAHSVSFLVSVTCLDVLILSNNEEGTAGC